MITIKHNQPPKKEFNHKTAPANVILTRGTTGDIVIISEDYCKQTNYRQAVTIYGSGRINIIDTSYLVGEVLTIADVELKN